MTFASALENMGWMLIPPAVYAIGLRWRHRVQLHELRKRLGLVVGDRRSYFWAVLSTLPFVPLVIWVSQWTSTFEGSMIAPFVGAAPSLAVLAGAANYGLIATGFPEELLFRGLIAGSLFRRTTFWKANVSQACIFVLPHLLRGARACGSKHGGRAVRTELVGLTGAQGREGLAEWLDARRCYGEVQARPERTGK
jgi:membrane protease YdiL (CAAX protease family)